MPYFMGKVLGVRVQGEDLSLVTSHWSLVITNRIRLHPMTND